MRWILWKLVFAGMLRCPRCGRRTKHAWCNMMLWFNRTPFDSWMLFIPEIKGKWPTKRAMKAGRTC
jgi:hypothetical protein